MIKSFPLDFVRQALEQTLLEEHIKNTHYFGGKDQVNILSFYEQLKSQDEVDRFVETYRDLTEQQNRTGLILNGVLVSPENPTITNLYSSLIVPMSWTCSLRSTLANRDQAIVTINNLIEKMKGRKVDIAQLKCNDENGKDCYVPFMVGTLGQGGGALVIRPGDYIGTVTSANNAGTKITSLRSQGFSMQEQERNSKTWLYAEYENKLCVFGGTYVIQTSDQVNGFNSYSANLSSNTITASLNLDENDITVNNSWCECDIKITGSNGTQVTINNIPGKIVQKTSAYNYDVKFVLDKNFNDYFPSGETASSVTSINFDVFYAGWEWSKLENDGSHNEIVFPPEHESFEKYKLSLSFDATRCDEPRNLNGNEYCELTFSGQATLVNETAKLGNDLLKIAIKRDKIIKQSGTTTYADDYEYLEPLEMPSGNNANTKINQLITNSFKTNTHTDGIALSLQYTFIADDNSTFLSKLFDYARYGEQTYITPNIIYSIKEIWCYWGNVKIKTIPTKIVETTEIDNTESDVLSLSLNMQIQGDNN